LGQFSGQFFNTGFQTGAWNMAIDEVLFQNCKQKFNQRKNEDFPDPIFLRVYGWSKPTITVGRFQSIKRDFDLEKSLAQGLDVCRRLSGGRAVLHDCELTYSITGTSDILGKKISETYEKISYGIKSALDKLGIESDFVLPEKKVYSSNPSCFATYSVREILYQGHKISGSAQYREGDTIIQHGNILFRSAEKKLLELFKFRKSENFTKKNGIGIFDILGIDLKFDSVAEELKIAFEKVLDINLNRSCLRDEDIENAHKLVKKKYTDLSWNKAS